jgi:cell division protein FtsN
MQQLRREHGGTFLGFVLGMVMGLGIALAVAVYVTKVPVTFVNKVMNRTAEQDASEQQKNKNWDPNAPLYGKNPAKPANDVAPPEAPKPLVAPAVKGGAPAPAPVVTAPASQTDAKPEPDTPGADPLGDLSKARAAAPAAALDPFTYYVQVGAYRTDEDAQSQRVKLSLAGFETKVSQREQAGKPVFRVRMGPFETRDEANQAKDKLKDKGFETVMVRVQR